jgi:hypothetical protein
VHGLDTVLFVRDEPEPASARPSAASPPPLESRPSPAAVALFEQQRRHLQSAQSARAPKRGSGSSELPPLPTASPELTGSVFKKDVRFSDEEEAFFAREAELASAEVDSFADLEEPTTTPPPKGWFGRRPRADKFSKPQRKTPPKR